MNIKDDFGPCSCTNHCDDDCTNKLSNIECDNTNCSVCEINNKFKSDFNCGNKSLNYKSSNKNHLINNLYVSNINTVMQSTSYQKKNSKLKSNEQESINYKGVKTNIKK